VSGVLSDQGKPIAGGLVVLQRLKDEKCVRLFTSRNLSSKDAHRLESCIDDLPWMNTNEHGNYSYQQVAPGWYNIRFLWLTGAAWPGAGLECWASDWVVRIGSQKDRTGKYNAFAQGMPFELRGNESRRVDFDYQNLVNRGPGCAPYPSSQPVGSTRARISIPGSGSLELDPGPSPWQSLVSDHGFVVEMQAFARLDHLLVTAFLQKVAFEASPEKCRNKRWPRSEKALLSRKAKLDQLLKSSQENTVSVEFMLQDLRGEKLQMKDLHVYLGKADVCAEVHLSKVYYVPEDQKLFDQVLSTVRLSTNDSKQ
jgi:hypothetical protein